MQAEGKDVLNFLSREMRMGNILTPCSVLYHQPELINRSSMAGGEDGASTAERNGSLLSRRLLVMRRLVTEESLRELLHIA